MGWNIGSNEIEFQRDSPMIELILNHCHHHQRSESISYEVHGFITITLVEGYTCIYYSRHRSGMGMRGIIGLTGREENFLNFLDQK